MAFGPKSAQKRARKVRKANRMAQALGYRGAQSLITSEPTLTPFTAIMDAAIAAIEAGY